MLTIITLIVLFIITWIVIACNATTPLPECCMNCLHSKGHDCLRFSPNCCNHFGIRGLRDEIARLEHENERIRYEFESFKKFHELRREKKYYAVKVGDQAIADLIKKASLSIEEVAKKLDIEIVEEPVM